MVDFNDQPQPVELEINGILDLHAFKPGDIKQLVPDYLNECRKKNIYQVRIIHGKGIGNVRRSVHAILERLPSVVQYRLADGHQGGWGATIVQLK